MTLQELCLAAIGRSLEILCYAYYTTVSDNLRLGFQFLQKAYTSELVSLWVKNVDLFPDYADLVFSKYLKSMDTGWFTGCTSWEIIFDTFARIGPNLENVFFSEDSKCFETARFNEDSNHMQWKDIICYLPNVKCITYQRFCDNSILECIAKYCPKIETLDIKRSSVTDDGLKYFYQKEQGKLSCPLLKEIFVQPTSFGYESIKQLLINLPLLEKFDYSELPFTLYTMHKDDLSSIDKAQRYSLKHLNILNYADLAHIDFFDDILEVCITVCPKLKSFHCPLYKLEHSNMCSMLPEVEALYLHCVNYNSIEVNVVLEKKGVNIKSLTLQNCSFSLSILAHCCPHLKELTVYISHEYIQCNENDSIPKFYNLKVFTIENANLSNPDYCKAICCILASSPTLENLYLKRCDAFSLEIKTKILNCCKQYALKHIYFGGSPLEAQFIKNILLTCSTLESLTVEVSGMDYVTEKDLCRFSWDLPNSPKLCFIDELSENFSADASDIADMSSDNDELNENFSSTSSDSVEMLIDTDELSENFSDNGELSNGTGELSEDFGNSS